MPYSAYCGAWRLLISCLGVFAVTTAAPRNISVDIQPRQSTTDQSLKILSDIHGKTYALSISQTPRSYLVESTVSCFTLQLLYSLEEADHIVMLWLHYTESDGSVKRVDTVNFAVKKEKATPENNLRFEFEGSSKIGLIIKEAEFVYHPKSCYTLKITLKERGCVFLDLPSSFGTSTSKNCVSKDQLGDCEYEAYETSNSEKCLQYTVITDNSPSGASGVTAQSPPNRPLLETDPQLQQYQDFKRGLLFSSLVLVYSSFGDDPFRFCMITYSSNKGPGKDGKLYILTSGVSVNQLHAWCWTAQGL
uniref:Putative secreted histamine binding protein of 21.3 kDa n=1 Tax=Ixodes ricinus TaxID=34613 RepID=V5GMT9_IXORI